MKTEWDTKTHQLFLYIGNHKREKRPRNRKIITEILEMGRCSIVVEIIKLNFYLYAVYMNIVLKKIIEITNGTND